MEKIIPIFEDKKLKDKVNMVNLFVNDELVESTHNLVVYKGREFAVQKVLNVSTGAPSDLRSYNITHFAIGSGGTESDNLTALVGPLDNDYSIYKGIQLSQSNTTYLSYTDQQGNTINYGAKPITLDGGGIEIIQDTVTGSYTTAKVTLIIDPSLSDDNLTSTFLLSEAALFYVDNSNNQVKGLFAHVCFSGKYIDPTDKVKIEWYLLF
jgi:hypothetical protein